MMTRSLSAAIAFAGATILFGGSALSAQMMGQGMGRGMGHPSMARHHEAMMNGIPAKFADLRNPLPIDSATLSAGRQVYQADCASCHGAEGRGDGPLARTLNPPPADLAWSARMPLSRQDGYLYWTIAEGGQQFGTAMPAFGQALTRKQAWSVIAYIQHDLGR
ncbi:c-type cytochrome [Stakelama marina]|uniref:Cytochrome c n=1 Tax=Stakelama marina TaxID=2826939 RepID=A0A8T4ILW8_9SPHN|nr:cytochrome c [Stakelama marina]MBR0553156.1 cytochrome c [Stakelama marina]